MPVLGRIGSITESLARKESIQSDMLVFKAEHTLQSWRFVAVRSRVPVKIFPLLSAIKRQMIKVFKLKQE